MANKIYQIPETAITWLAAAGTEDLTLTSLAAGTGRQGAQHDFGTSARSPRFSWRFFMNFSTTPIVDEIVQIYWKTSDGTHPDNDDGTGDIALSSADKLNNLELIGTLIVDEAATGVEMVASGEIELGQRHGSPVIFNNTVDVFSATAGDMGFILTPIPFEIQ